MTAGLHLSPMRCRTRVTGHASYAAVVTTTPRGAPSSTTPRGALSSVDMNVPSFRSSADTRRSAYAHDPTGRCRGDADRALRHLAPVACRVLPRRRPGSVGGEPVVAYAGALGR